MQKLKSSARNADMTTHDEWRDRGPGLVDDCGGGGGSGGERFGVKDAVRSRHAETARR